MVLSDSGQSILTVSSPLTNIALVHKDSSVPHTPSSTTATTTGATKSSVSSSSAASVREKKSTSFASEKRRAIHENAKKSQRSLVEGNGNNSVLSFMYRHQLDIPAVLIALVLVCHFGFRIPLAETFLVLQNRDPITGLYSKAWSDLNFIFFWIVLFTFLRALVMTKILKPIATRCGVRREHQRIRFQEEGWVCLYYSASWTLGMASVETGHCCRIEWSGCGGSIFGEKFTRMGATMAPYVLHNSPVWNNWSFWFKPEALFEGYPHTRLPHIMLWYYYVQLAFWLQQVFVLQVEVPRKDFWALMAHHTVTLLLISGSAISNFWRAGNVVFVVMDLADIILAFSKSIKYLGVANRICDAFFGCFMVSWLYTRHYLYGYILHAFMFTAYEMIPFELDIAQGKWYCRELAWLPILGLCLLQILMVYWFALILRIVLKILKGQSAEDDRSDDEQ
ncbi:sphingosine N-acyltransferase lag1 [Mortierella polycephala]|uniref:Sphingosine N-acyltransferase lag1 n=1 Tax=Mortierella polycephala TaxID=41804 RepID=A0A9P6PWE7_9FUNG|nr:sphingosine N-acyltransferase lag1 [Mortierella polycephala]